MKRHTSASRWQLSLYLLGTCGCRDRRAGFWRTTTPLHRLSTRDSLTSLYYFSEVSLLGIRCAFVFANCVWFVACQLFDELLVGVGSIQASCRSCSESERMVRPKSSKASIATNLANGTANRLARIPDSTGRVAQSERSEVQGGWSIMSDYMWVTYSRKICTINLSLLSTFSYASTTFLALFLSLSPPGWALETFSVYLRKWRPSASTRRRNWELFSTPKRRLRCSWPARSAKCNPREYD